MPKRIQPPVDLSVFGYMPDGEPYYAPLGRVAQDEVTGKVQCHLCGVWLLRIATSHLVRTHGVTTDEYRKMFSLSAKSVLQGSAVSAAMRERMTRRIAVDPHLRRSMAVNTFPRGRPARRIGTRLTLDHRLRIQAGVDRSARVLEQRRRSNAEALAAARTAGFETFAQYVAAERLGKSLTEIARLLGRSRTWVANRLDQPDTQASRYG